MVIAQENAMFKLLPDEPAQRLRMTRFLIALASYALAVGSLFALMALNAVLIPIDPTALKIFTLALAIFNLIFYIVLRSGLNQRLPDPSLTRVQIAVAIISLTFLMYHAYDLRPLMIIFYPAILLFGQLRLNTRQLLKMSLFAILCFTAMAGLLLMRHREQTDSYLLLMELLLLIVILPWYALIGGYMSRLRQQVRNTNRQLEQALEAINEIAIRDDLTQVYNRRYLMQLLTRQKNITDRGGHPFAVCLLDLDLFKRINDTFGHQAGDVVLTTLTEQLGKHMRNIDFLGRYGGEEFLLVLVDTNLAGALEVAERVRSLVMELRFPGLDGVQVTISAGVAEYEAGESIDQLLERADRALYQAKNEGRNRVLAIAQSASGEERIVSMQLRHSNGNGAQIR
jgi:diguanylate cyclase (GGDEF)-like protein